MSLKGAENLTLHGEDGKKYVVTEIYYNNITDRAFEVYYTDESTTKPILIWKYSDDDELVPFDTDTCQVVIETDETGKKFDIKVYKNYGTETQKDITKSLDTCRIYAYLVNDIFPNNSIFGYQENGNAVGMKIPNETVPNVAHFYPLTITSGMLGKYSLQAGEAYSKVSGQAAPKVGYVRKEMDLPYSLTENTSVAAYDLWVKVTSPYDMEVGRVSFPVADAGTGQGGVQLITDCGVGCFYGYFNGTPSVEKRTVNGVDYNYVVYDVSALKDQRGAFKFMPAGDTYYLRAYFNPHNKTNHPFARNSKMLSEIAYSTNVGDYTGEYFDLSEYKDFGLVSTEPELVQIPTNYFAEYTGDTHTFTKNCIYLNKNTSVISVTGSTDDYSTIYKSKELGAVYYYTGSNHYGYEFYQYNFYKIISVLDAEDESDINEVVSLPLNTKFYWIGETITDVLTKDCYYKVNKTLSNFKGNFIGTSTGLPDYTTLSVGDIFIGFSWYNEHYSGVNGVGVYTVTNVTDTLITVSKEAPSVYFTECTTETIKSVCSNITTTLKNGMTLLSHKDMSSVTDNTDCGYEILLTAKT